MGQAVRPQRLGQGIQRTGAGERAWLSMLVDTMEKISRENMARPDLRTAPCDARLLTTVRLQLGRSQPGRSVVPHRPINHAARSGHRTKSAI
jgi:hypothetical protein